MAPLSVLNDLLFLKLNADSGTPALLMAFANFAAVDLAYVIPSAIVIIWLSGGYARRAAAVRTMGVLLICLSVNQTMNLVWPYPRPFMIGLGRQWLEHAANSSFPSDHMTIFCATAFSLIGSGMMRTGLAMFGTGLVCAWSRIFLGVHYPLDMLGGLAVAAVVYSVSRPYWRARGRETTRRVEALYHVICDLPVARLVLPR